jgi:hypothetical protein
MSLVMTSARSLLSLGILTPIKVVRFWPLGHCRPCPFPQGCALFWRSCLRGSVCRRRHSVEEVLQKPQDPVLGDEGQLEKHQHGTMGLIFNVVLYAGWSASSSSLSGQRTQSRLWLSPSVPCACSFHFPPWWCCFLEFSHWPADTIEAVAVSFSALCLFISLSSLWCLFLEFSLRQVEKSHLCGGLSQGDEQLE